MDYIQCNVWIQYDWQNDNLRGTPGLDLAEFRKMLTDPNWCRTVFEELKRQALANGWCTGPLTPHRVDTDFLGDTNTWFVSISQPDIRMDGNEARIFAFEAGLHQ